MSGNLPPISEAQKKWAIANFPKAENARRFRNGNYDISHFIVATTKGGWQVLRHYYLYARYRYKKLHSTEFHEIMEHWFKDGKYVFMARNRYMGYCTDGWIFSQPMSIKKKYCNYVLEDPRTLGYDGVYYARLLDKFSYIERDSNNKYRIDTLFRALNAHPFNETLQRNHDDEWRWSIKNGFAFDSELTSAIKIAMRHKYIFMNPIWKDMVEMLCYLKKDVHNPKYVCPNDLMAMHDKIGKLALSKRVKENKRWQERTMILAERRRLAELRAEAEREERQKKEAKSLVGLYKRMRGRFFGVVIAENDLEIKVLQSVDEFMDEAKEMHHCVFSNAYYDVRKKPNCLILSAKVNGERMETIEVDLKDFTIVQCRGKYNQNTEWHDMILKLLNDNMYKIKEIA